MEQQALTAAVVASLAALGCGGGELGRAVAPTEMSASEALGYDAVPCATTRGYAEPLVVDWSADQRLALELAMRDGLVVVAYGCDRFELLSECGLDGSYAFAGVSLKEDVIQLENRDELAANMPLGAAKLASSLERGASIDLALARVGKRTTTVREVARADLHGLCDGATHVVRAATIGAFAMTRGTAGEVRAAAEVFGGGGHGSSRSDRRSANRDGDLAACRAARTDAGTPPDQCQAALRLELVPIAAERLADPAAPATADARPEPAPSPCPPGFVHSAGKCTRPEAGTIYTCTVDDADECMTECQLGSIESCHNLAVLYERGVKVATHLPTATALYEHACNAGRAESCERAGLLTTRACYQAVGAGAPLDSCDAAWQRSAALSVRACDGGIADACWTLAIYDKLLPLSGRNKQELQQRACDLGHGSACGLLGIDYVNGNGVAQDVARGMGILQRACDGGGILECKFLGDVLGKGEAVPHDPRRRLVALDRACSLGLSAACTDAAEMLARGDIGVEADAAAAAERWGRGCWSWLADKRSCSSLGSLLRGQALGTPANAPERQDLYGQAMEAFARACTLAGEGCRDAVELADLQATQSLERSCAAGNAAACTDLATELLVAGCERDDATSCRDLEQRDAERAKAVSRRSCAAWGWRADLASCQRFVALGGELPTPPAPPRPGARALRR